jgi:alkylation response protein AidB-like acyl-CoA dehydrogenase
VNFDPTEEQQLVAASIARFVTRDYGFEARRRIVASEKGCSDAVWRTMAELGLLGLTLPAAHGGLGGGAMDAMSLMEAIGDALIVEPWLATVGLGAQVVARAASAEQQARILPQVTDGTLKLAFADGASTVRAARSDGGLALSGAVRVVPGADAAHVLVVAFELDEDTALAPVDRGAAGVTTTPLRMLDGTRAADVLLEDVRIGDDARLAAAQSARPVIDDVLDFATALVCAEAVGAIASANAATLDYLRTRRQFGVPIGAFQALQHRMVDLAIELEQARSMAALACSSVDHVRDRRTRARNVSAAKVRIADACRRVSQESIQLHGGMGMSDEMKVSHTFRRLTVIAQQFGDADRHLARFAALDTAEDAA